MASATRPVVYWCHQCNVQTRPIIGEDLLCSFCNCGFIEELDNAEFEPGVAFSTLPLAFGNFLRMPSPASVGTPRDRYMTNTPSAPQQASPFSSSSSSSSTTSSSTTQPQMQRTSSGQQQMNLQGHRPRILSSQLSGVPSLLEAMLQVIEEMNGSATEDARESQGPMPQGDHGVHASRRHGSRDSSEDSHSQMQSANEEGGHAFVLPVPPMLILHGDMPNGSGSLEIFVDNGRGMGPQMMPNQFRDYFMGPDLDRLIQMLAENDPNRYGTPPAAKSEVEKLPKLKITEEYLGSDAVQCAVCKDDFELEAEVLQMPCKHIYHPDCILPWLAEHNSCPMCRFELPTDDADYEARKGQAGSAQANANPTEGLRTGIRTSSNLSEGQGGRAANSGNVEVPQGSRPFTLWGMPAVNPFTQMEDLIRHAELRQGQDVSREDGIRDGAPVQWLFRLFSSGSLSDRDNASNAEQSPEPGNGRSSSNS